MLLDIARRVVCHCPPRAARADAPFHYYDAAFSPKVVYAALLVAAERAQRGYTQ